MGPQGNYPQNVYRSRHYNHPYAQPEAGFIFKLRSGRSPGDTRRQPVILPIFTGMPGPCVRVVKMRIVMRWHCGANWVCL